MKIGKIEKLVANLHDKTEFVIHTRNLKQACKSWISFEKNFIVMKFNQKVWLKSYIEMNTELRKKSKFFFKLMNNLVFGKTMENVRKHRDNKLLISEKRRNCLVSEPNYHSIKFFTEDLLAIEMRKMDTYK